MTIKNEKTRRGLKLNKFNPFTRKVTNKRGNVTLVNPVIAAAATNPIVFDIGESDADINGFWETEEVDEVKFVKLFVGGVKALKELSGSGAKVFELLYLKIQNTIGEDKVYMSFNQVDQVMTPMSSATYSRGMRELVEKKIIAPSEDIGLFWFDRSFVLNGDRLAFVTDYRNV